MGFSDGPEMVTWFSGARKDPVVVCMALTARLEKFEKFPTHRQSTLGVHGFSTHDQDGSVEEVEIEIASVVFARIGSLGPLILSDARIENYKLLAVIHI